VRVLRDARWAAWGRRGVARPAPLGVAARGGGDATRRQQVRAAQQGPLRVICKGQLTMEEIMVSLKHYWRLVDLAALA